MSEPKPFDPRATRAGRFIVLAVFGHRNRRASAAVGQRRRRQHRDVGAVPAFARVASHDRVRRSGNRELVHAHPAAHDARARDGHASGCSTRSATAPSTCSAIRSAARSRRRWPASTRPASTASCSRPPAAAGAPCPVTRSRCWRCSRRPATTSCPATATVNALFGGSRLTDFVTADAARLHRPPDPIGYWWQLLAALGWSSLPWLHRVRAPTLVLAAARDRLVRASTARTLARRIPDSRLEVVPDANHFFLLREDTRAASKLVTSFLDEQRTGQCDAELACT